MNKNLSNSSQTILDQYPDKLLEKYLESAHPLSAQAKKICESKRLDREDALSLYASDDLLALAGLADFARRRQAGLQKANYVYYIHNMHLNPTNFCVETCRFCSYANPEGKEGAYTWTIDQVLEQVAHGAQLGISEIHMVGGLNPACNLDYYEEVLRAVKRQFPHIHMKAMTAVEIEYLANLEGISFVETLERLINAGLDQCLAVAQKYLMKLYDRAWPLKRHRLLSGWKFMDWRMGWV